MVGMKTIFMLNTLSWLEGVHGSDVLFAHSNIAVSGKNECREYNMRQNWMV